MSAQNIISLGFNVDELSAQQKQVLQIMQDMFAQLDKYDGTKFNPLGSGGLTDLKKSLIDGASAMEDFQATIKTYNQAIADQVQKQTASKKSTDDLSLAEKEHEKTLRTIIETRAKLSEADTNAANDKAIELQRLKAVNQEVNLAARAYLSQIGSVNEAKAAVAQLTSERNKENANTEEGRARILELNAAIDKNNQFIKDNVSALEQQKINIGNYTGAIGVLQPALNDIAARLANMAANGDQASEAYQKLTLEQQILQQTLDRQSGGFATVTAELRSTKSALDALTVAGLENTEGFEKLNLVYEQAKQKVNELHAEQRILTSESPAITALTTAARGLGGAYALGAGASALFADGNEKVEKELSKLIAIMTLLQGLEEAVKAVKERGAIATALQAVATKALNAVKDIETKLFGTNQVAIETETVARVENTEITAANTEALAVNAEGAVVNEAAMEGVAVATDAATTATIGFSTALVATGVGAIIIALIYGITKLVGAINDWATADEKAAEKAKDLADASKSLFDYQQKLNDVFEEGARKQVDALDKVGSKLKEAGDNQFIQLDNERKIAQQRQQNAREELAYMGLINGGLQSLADERLDALYKVEGIESTIRELRKVDDKSDVEKYEKEKAAAQAEFDFLDSQYTKGIAAQKTYDDEAARLEENSIAQSKASADLLAKIYQDQAERRYSLLHDSNDRILSDEKSTEQQREAAIASNFAAETALEHAKAQEVERQLKANYITQAEASDQLAQLDTDLTLKRRKALEDRDKVRKEYSDRELQARNSISKSGNESDASTEQAITKDIQKELEVRLQAQKQFIADRTAIIADQYTLDVRLANESGKTQTEIQAITAAKDKELVALTASSQKEIYDIVISYGEKRIKAIEELNKTGESANDVSGGYGQATEKLNQSLLDQQISYGRYVNEKRRLDNEYSIEKTQADVDDDKKALDRLQKFLNDELRLKIEAAQRDLTSAQAGGNDQEIAKAEAKANALRDIQIKAQGDLAAANKKYDEDYLKAQDAKIKKSTDAEQFIHDKTIELADSTVSFVKTAVDAGYENRINQIQHTMDIQDQQSAQEIAGIRNSTLSARDQAAETIVLQAQQNARDTQLRQQMRQEKIQEAKFNRDVAVAETIWKTAQAEISAIGEYAGTPYAFAVAAVIAAIGAVNVATILAQPIPTYAQGVDSHPGGLAIVGEEYKPERVSIPGRAPFIVDTPTLLDLPTRSSVLPLNASDMVMELGTIGMIRGMNTVSNPKANTTAWDVARWQTAEMKKALSKNNRNIKNIVNVNVDGRFENWVNRKIKGRA